MMNTLDGIESTNGANTTNRLPGIYGKLPAHGDFVDRGLPVSFIKQWDQWLQQAFAASGECLGKGWLTTYLTSPIWRFVQSEGVIDGRGWAGILVPSVDSVGRYFPLTLAMPLQANEKPARFLADNVDLFTVWESIALQALQETLNADALFTQLSQSPAALATVTKTTTETTGRHTLVQGQAVSMNEQNPWALLLDAQMSLQDDSYSLWSCSGSSCMPPMLLQCRGLPDPRKYTAMLDGQWQTMGWSTSL
jgi:type VI secretion system protein ImpM